MTIGTNTNVINIYYTKRTDLSYTVNYLEKDTNKVLHVAKTTVNQTFGTVITSSDEVISIDGYNYNSVDKATLTIGTSANVINVYYTANIYEYVINYVEKDNETNLLKTTTGSAVYKSEVLISEESFDGFTYDSQDKESIVIDLEANEATVYYTRKDGTVKVIYIDKENNEISPSETYTGKYDEGYSVSPKEISKYKLSDVIGEESGKYIDGEITVTYIYEKIPDTGLFENNISGYVSMMSMVVFAVLLVVRKKLFN